MLCRHARRPVALLATVLGLSLALPVPTFGPWPAAAQAPGLQIVVEQPTAGSEALGTIVVGGWAVDTASPSGTGIAPDGVEVWLGPAGSGQLLGAAGYGDPRPDAASRLGGPRFLPVGFRFFWNSCDTPEGPNVLTVTARSSFAPNRTAATTVPITVGPCELAMGETVTARIYTSGQADAWSFEGVAGQRVAITLDGTDGWDTLLELIRPDGTREDIDDDGGPGLNSWLTRPLSRSGTYTIIARPLSTEGCTGDYVVLGWIGPAGSSDPSRAAGALGTTASFIYRGSIREFGEQQSWTFDAQSGQELILYTTRNVGSPLDPFIELYGPDGRILARDDDGGGGLNSFLQGLLPEDGTYTLRTRALREDCGGEYSLRIEPEWGEQTGLRGPLPFGDTVAGSLSLDVRRDVWTFPATAGERVTLTLDTSGPVRLGVAAPSGAWEQGRASRGRPVGLSFEPAESGTYSAVVFVGTSRDITYDLTLERGAGRLVSEMGPITLGQPVQGEIVYVGGRDRYTFEGRQGQQVRITLERQGRTQFDPYLELLDPDGRTVAEDDDSGGGLNSLIQVALPRTGTYTVVARDLADATGPYTLTVRLSGDDVPGDVPGPAPATPSPTPARPPGSPTPTAGPAGPAPSPGPTQTPGTRPTVPPTGPPPTPGPQP